MKDFLTRSELSNGSLSVENLIDYSYRQGIDELGIVELEVLPNFVKTDKLNVHYGIELLSNNINEGLVIYNITNLSLLKEKLNAMYMQEQTELLKEAVKIFDGSKLFDAYLKKTSVLNIYHVVKMLIEFGYSVALKSSLKLLENFITTSKPDIDLLVENYKTCGTLYLRTDDINFTKSNVRGIIFTGEKSEENIKTLLEKCRNNKQGLLFGSNFDNHKTGEIIGA